MLRLIRQLGAVLRQVWQHRRDTEFLAGLDDHMLADIGLSRADVQDALAVSRWHDPTALLIDRRCERRASLRGEAAPAHSVGVAVGPGHRPRVVSGLRRPAVLTS
jgi:uncharacterized protein YjiS (DUF1127 family)